MSSDTWLPDLWTSAQQAAAAEARSILACPSTAALVVDGLEEAIDDHDLSLIDDSGTPVLLTLAGTPLDAAAATGAPARLVVDSALDEQDGAPSQLILVGHLVRHHACARGQVVVTLDIDHLLLHGDGAGQPTVAIEAAHFARPELRLNRGYLQRSARHANESHQAELRAAVSTATGTRLNAIAGVHLEQLTTTGVVLTWIDNSGAHRTEFTFDQPARTPEELAGLLSAHLHSDLC